MSTLPCHLFPLMVHCLQDDELSESLAVRQILGGKMSGLNTRGVPLGLHYLIKIICNGNI